MVMYEAGMLARSKAGHDKAQMYIIKEVDDTYVSGGWPHQNTRPSEEKEEKACTDRSRNI